MTSEYGTPCPGCRKILHVKIELEPEPERATEPPEQRTRPETTAGAILGGIVSLESLIEHLDEPRASVDIDTRWIENRAQDGIDALVRVRDEAPTPQENQAAALLVDRLTKFGHQAEPDDPGEDKTGACPYRTCTDARNLAKRLRGGFPESHIKVVGAVCGCSIRKGPPWKLETCETHRPRRGMSVAEAYEAAAMIARSGRLEMATMDVTKAVGVTMARTAIADELDRRAGNARRGMTQNTWGDFMSAVRNACNELNDLGNDAGHQLMDASSVYRADGPWVEPKDPRLEAMEILRAFIPEMPETVTLDQALHCMIRHIGGTTGADKIEWDGGT